MQIIDLNFCLESIINLNPDEKYVQGLNETAAGLVAPNWLAKTFEEVIGRRQAEKVFFVER